MAAFPNTISLPENRLDLEALIEAAIARLDDVEPDPDLEPDGDGEPILGAPEARSGSWNGLAPDAYTDDREADDGDGEPSLGSLNRVPQTRWAAGGSDDFEDEHDGREPCCEDEGAQCDDEGAVDEDCGYDDDDPGTAYLNPANWRTDLEAQTATTGACAAAIGALRQTMRADGLVPVPMLRVLDGAAVRP